MAIKHISLSLLLLLSCNAVAFEGCKIKITQHSTDKNKSDKSATLLYTHSKDDTTSDEDKETYAIDAALSYQCPDPRDTSTSEYMFAVEVHKNDLIAKKNDSLAFRSGWFIENILSEKTSLLLSLGHVTDNVKEMESIQVIAETDFLIEEWYVNNPYRGNNWAFMWSPVAAIEYENVIDSPNDQDGNVFRGMFGVGSTLSFFRDKADEYYKVELGFTYNIWKNFDEDDRLELPDDHDLKIIELRYILDKSDIHEISLNYKWNDGEDIRNKTNDQEYDQIGFGLKFIFD